MGLRHSVLVERLRESFRAVLPISVIIPVVSLFCGVSGREVTAFLIGDVLVVVGLALFSIGSVESTAAIAASIGEHIVRRRSLVLFVLVAFLVGFLITVAEPALWVLADQFKSVVPPSVLILTVAVGVGLFVILALVRILLQFSLVLLFAISYAVLFLIAGGVALANPGFIPIAFDAGGVTTGPMAVPFIMSLGYGIARARGDRSSETDSFGLVGIASIGPILSVLLLGLFTAPSTPVSDTTTTLGEYFVHYLIQMAFAILPFILFFAVFQCLAFRLSWQRVVKVLIAFVYTYTGLVLFLTGANAGLVNIGVAIGASVGALSWNWVLVPLGMLFGFTVVAAEPSVVALNRQVEEASAGAISRGFMMAALSTGVSLAIGLACLRVLTGLSIWWILLPGYALTILLTAVTPRIFASIAFDSGGAVSGAMTSAFLMPYALGASAVIGTDILADAFGLVAFVAMAPLVTIQVLGLVYRKRLQAPPPAVAVDVGIVQLGESSRETAGDRHPQE